MQPLAENARGVTRCRSGWPRPGGSQGPKRVGRARPDALHLLERIEELAVLEHGVTVGHSRQVVADHLTEHALRIRCAGYPLDTLAEFRGQLAGVLHVGVEKAIENPLAFSCHPRDPVMAIHVLVKEFLETGNFLAEFSGELHWQLFGATHVLQGPNSHPLDSALRVCDQVRHLPVDQQPHHVVTAETPVDVGMDRAGSIIQLGPDP